MTTKKKATKKKTQNKTARTGTSVSEFLKGVDDPQKRKDCKAVAKMMREITGQRAAMWGTSIVGFGTYHYVYESGREGDFFLAGFSPRKQNLTLYIMDGFSGYKGLMKKLGKYKTGKSCLYIKRLEDVDEGVLRKLIEGSVAATRKKYPS